MIKLGVIGFSKGNGHPYSWSAICNGYNPEHMSSCGFPDICNYLAKRSWPHDGLNDVSVTHVWCDKREQADHIAKAANIHLDVSVEQEACPHNLTPTSSTTAALVMGDAIAITLLNARGFTPEDFAKSHPSGTLGRKLLTLVSSIMKVGDDIPLVAKETPLVESILVMSQKSLGMVIITDNEYSLQGIFTDGDLRRVLEKNSNIQDLLIKHVMTSDCKSIGPDKPALLAFHMMDENRLNSLPVVDANNQVIGAINMHTLMQAKVV